MLTAPPFSYARERVRVSGRDGYDAAGGEWGLVSLPVFKTGEPPNRGWWVRFLPPPLPAETGARDHDRTQISRSCMTLHDNGRPSLGNGADRGLGCPQVAVRLLCYSLEHLFDSGKEGALRALIA